MQELQIKDYEAYERYYSTDRLPFHVPFNFRRFKLLAIAVLVFVLVSYVRFRYSGVADFDLSLGAHISTKTLGGVLRCDPEVMKPSAKTPDDVNQVRPADINVIAAMGDSITASFIICLKVAELSRNYDDDLYNVYPGNSYVIGGDETLEKHISVANILRVFNPSIVGMSHGTGYDNTVFNVAVSGRTSMDIPRQAEELIHRMKARGVRLKDDWKLISIFIGTNDLGELRCYSKEKRGEYDKSFYASDIFHLSKYGNAVLAKFLWNNLIEPVDRKTTKANLGNDDFPIMCPPKVC
ncbi:unnamed protein product [Angiostrongylus costaricensis]|uniref:SGNH_hydro domain-containing protein n=1 Tax=Angiostrongylus costaricensis TaxID=334426 RepID=A0A158PMM6_ANGCS|nr:unnamed protein product [Angiostrongylus costaricensis]